MKHFIPFILAVLLSASCGAPKLAVNAVSYESLKNAKENLKSTIPENAEIFTLYLIDKDGNLSIIIKNLTDKIMTIDKRNTFYVDRNGKSNSLYDPTIRTTTTTDIKNYSFGSGVNLGVVGNALGVGGLVGQILYGITTSGSYSTGTAKSNSTITQDQALVSIAPRSEIDLGVKLKLEGVGYKYLHYSNPPKSSYVAKLDSYEKARNKYNIVISYSFDEGKTKRILNSKFYCNSLLISPVKESGKVNDALRSVIISKPDLLSEQWYMLYASTNMLENGCSTDAHMEGYLYDYQ